MYTIGSLFDGIGGFPLAAQRNGMKAIWASEIEKFPIEVTKIRFPDMKHLGDITKLNGAEIGPVDIITGGSPCQDLSIAGKREGLAGKRSGLFMEQVRIVREMREHERRNAGTACNIRPRFMLWENVPGAFSSNKGEDFRAVLEETARIADETIIIPGPPKGKWNTAGCIMGDGWSIAWRVLDAQFWGVPQRRRRIFLVADFGGQSAPEVLFKREGLSRNIAESGEARERVATNIERCTAKTMLIRGGCEGGGKGPLIQEDKSATLSTGNVQTLFAPVAIDSNCQDSRFKLTGDVMPTLPAKAGTGGNNGPMLAVPKKTYCIQGNCIDRADTAGCNGKGWTEDVSYTLNTIDRPAVCAGFCPEESAKTRGIGYEEEKSPTIREGVIPAVATYQKTTGPLMANSHPGSYSGQDAYNDMFVAGCDFRNNKENGDLSGTLQAKPNGGFSYNCIHPVRIGYSVRRLTPLECDRLQDYPDDWTKIKWQVTSKKGKVRWAYAKDGQRYKADGNSVAVCCPEYVMEGIKEVLDRDYIMSLEFLS